MTKQELIEAVLASLPVTNKGVISTNQDSLRSILNEKITAPESLQQAVSIDVEAFAKAMNALRVQPEVNETVSIVNALKDLKPDTQNSPFKKLSFTELDSIQQKMFQCLCSYDLSIGKEYFVDTKSLKSKPQEVKELVLKDAIPFKFEVIKSFSKQSDQNINL